MNASSRISTVRGFTPLLALAASMIIAPLSYAGPGVQFWQKADTKADTSVKVQAVSQVCSGCATMTRLDITTITHEWPNGRGPLQAGIIGSKKVCHSCSPASFVMKSGWVNARGPLQPVQLNVEHVCQSGLLAAN